MRYLAGALVLLCGGCAVSRESYPTRTATEQMLISEAAEQGAAKIQLKIPAGRRCYLDTTNFEGVDARYAVSAIKQKLLEQGLAIVDDRQAADTIIEIRSGALSIDSKGRQLVLPGLPIQDLLPVGRLPVPLSFNSVSNRVDHGIARFSAFAYDRATGTLIAVAEPVEGQSTRGRTSAATVVVNPLPRP